MAEIKLQGINKVYPNGFHAVKGLDLNINDKEFMVFVGPSGCGKTTTLRMVAGLEDITEGQIHIDDKLVNDIPPKNRDIAMVFQNYALYPHMSVYDNMAFGLKLRKVKKSDINERVTEVAKILGIEDLLDRKTKQLSGGQRQRVALGRAIVRNPKVFLMDEPLSNLDAKLRVLMRAELIKLHQKLKTTIIYVTHDQTEAMTMGSKICVMNEGLVQQVADPKTIYEKPANVFVAGFIGAPQMNFIDVNLTEEDNDIFIEFDDKKIKLPEDKAKSLRGSKKIGKTVTLGIRPQHINISEDNNKSMFAKVEVVELLGSETYIYFKINDKNFIASIDPDIRINPEEAIDIAFDMNKIYLFDKETGVALY